MVTEPECVIVWTTLPAGADVTTFGRILIEERLAACVSSQAGLRSVYRWRNDIEQAEELQVVIKTTNARVQQLGERIRQLHPYDVPEILVLPVVDGSPAYLGWVKESTISEAGAGGTRRSAHTLQEAKDDEATQEQDEEDE